MFQRLVEILRWVGERELRVLVTLAIAVAGSWAFIELADEVVEGETRVFDEWVLEAMRQPGEPRRPIGPRWLPEMARDLTALGGWPLLVLVTLVVAGFFGLTRKARLLVFLLVASGGGFALSHGLKALFDRPRPDLVPHLAVVSTSSFPSGHSMMAAVIYLTLGVLLGRSVDRRRLKAYFLAVALLLAVLVGSTRVYLGVHYPTDVLAGWTIGLVWAITCWLVARWLQRRGTVESQGRSQADSRGATSPGDSRDREPPPPGGQN